MTTEQKICCDEFRELVSAKSDSSPIAIAYSASGLGRDGKVEREIDGTYSILGCCGGGCNVVENVRFCPFCGASLLE